MQELPENASLPQSRTPNIDLSVSHRFRARELRELFAGAKKYFFPENGSSALPSLRLAERASQRMKDKRFLLRHEPVQIQGLFGAGYDGLLYNASTTSALPYEVVIKFLRPFRTNSTNPKEKEYRDRSLSEIDHHFRLARRGVDGVVTPQLFDAQCLKHPDNPSIRLPVLAVEKIPGITLAKGLEARQLLSEEAARSALSSLQQAQNILAASGIDVADTSPRNVLIRPDGRLFFVDLARDQEAQDSTSYGAKKVIERAAQSLLELVPRNLHALRASLQEF